MDSEYQPITRQVSNDAGSVHVELNHVSLTLGKKLEPRDGLADEICLLCRYICSLRAVVELGRF